MPLKPKEVQDLVRDQLMPVFRAEKEKLDRIDRWWRWDHDNPSQPRQATKEHTKLAGIAQTPWLGLVVTSVAQGLYVDGYRQEGERENAAPWRWWQANGMDARQVALHRAALAYGHAYTVITPGQNDFGERIPLIRGMSPRRMIAMYREPEHDDFPHFAMRCDPAKINGNPGYAIRVYDDEFVYFLNSEGLDAAKYLETRSHGVGFCPVVRFANALDLEGRTPGEVEPYIPVAARIDQTNYDRLVVQRFASWVVRTISGMARPESDEEAAAKKLQLWIDDVLVAEDSDTKFGSLPATPPDGFIASAEADVKVLAAVTQTPAHEMMGMMANMSAEALAAARASQTAKIDERRLPFGESHELDFRVCAHIMGDSDGANDVGAQVKWRDTSIRSLAQAADAIGKLHTMLGIPAKALLHMIPDLTQQDVQAIEEALKDAPPIPKAITPEPTPV